MFSCVIPGGIDSYGQLLQGNITRTVHPSIQKIGVLANQELEGITPKIASTVVKRQGGRPLVELV